MSETQDLLDTIISTQCRIYGKNEAIALAIHSYLFMKGFRNLETIDEDGLRLKENWNVIESQDPNAPHREKDAFDFKYRHSRAASRFFLKLVTLMNKMVINAMVEDNGQVHSLDLSLDEFIITKEINSVEGVKGEQLKSIYKNLGNLCGLLRLHLYNNLLSTTSQGNDRPQRNQEEERRTENNRREGQGRGPRPFYPGGNPPGGFPGGDPLMIGVPRRPTPFGFGDDDLMPGGYGVGGGIGGGGMHLGPGHPIFGGNPFPGGVGIPRPGGGGYYPPPPGARFDPFGPGSHINGDPDPDHEEPRADWMNYL